MFWIAITRLFGIIRRMPFIVRITADCPLIDLLEIDRVINEFFAQEVDFLPINGVHSGTHLLPSVWTEVCSFAALEKAWLDAAQGYEREHVMPYLYHVPGRFKVLRVDHVPDYGHLRWTVDTPADLELIQTIVNRFGGRQDFSWLDVLALFEQEPELANINAGVTQKTLTDTENQGNAS